MTRDELFKINIEKPSREAYQKCKENWDHLAKPLDGFGDFEDLVARIGGIQNNPDPDISKRAALIFCADNGIVEEGISQSGTEVTRKVAGSLGAGISPVCILGKSAGVRIIPLDIGIIGQDKIPGLLDRKVAEGTRNFLREPAMTEGQVLKAIECGISLVKDLKDQGVKIIASGEMGIGNTTTSAALIAALTGKDFDKLTGRGAGLDDQGFEKKKNVIKKGLMKYGALDNREDVSREYAFEILRSLGGLDIAGIIGLFIGGALYKIPVVMDGLITGAAGIAAELMVPGVKDYLIPSHKGRESGNETALDFLGLKPYINGDMALGEGTGALMLFPLMDIMFDYYKRGSKFSSYEMDGYIRFDDEANI
ncbi:MAG: nicotinate-nucleotide--dimethylbenzimidazole phosphoribosyltransferase [Eubacterium sp.]|nr:nicotinate-nucleotide--dimethylbenzimidazole phosphoribosyltransferase [Eubacterium sp.]